MNWLRSCSNDSLSQGSACPRDRPVSLKEAQDQRAVSLGRRRIGWLGVGLPDQTAGLNYRFRQYLSLSLFLYIRVASRILSHNMVRCQVCHSCLPSFPLWQTWLADMNQVQIPFPSRSVRFKYL